MQNCKVFWRLISHRLISSQKYLRSKTYYDVLNVSKNASSKEIRSAFVGLTKKFHPDASGNKTESQFVKISEAYNVLSKQDLRAAYDRQLLTRLEPLINSSETGYGKRTTEFHRPWNIKPDYDPNPGPYYGIKGVKRISNSAIALSLFALGVFLSIVGFISVSKTFSLSRAHYDRKSSEASSHHETVRAEAQKYGNQEQLKRLAHKMLRTETGASIKSQETNLTKQI